MRRRFRGTVGGAAFAAVLVLALTGCASTGEDAITEPHDPYEGFNRSMFAFNKALDDAVFNPVADGYVAITPEPARDAVFNFFDNLAYLTTVVNQLLQGKVERGFEDAGRFVINSTFGLAGLIDFAGGIGMPRHEEDFAQTLAVWGVGAGPYLELPILGPNTFRSLPGIPADAATDLLTWLGSSPLDYALTGLKMVDKRAGLDSAIELRDTSALDPYVFQREAYLQRRRSLIYDGNPPLEVESEQQR
jgi:phospholipid-binding lipoprotein MlaA